MSDDKEKKEKSDAVYALLDTLSFSISKESGKGMSRSEALSQRKCAKCGGDARKFKDEISKREYKLTAWCQGCQEDYFGY